MDYPAALALDCPATLQLWSYMYLCIYLRRSDEREMSSFEADVWAEINDTANPTFRWLSFDMVKSKSEEDLGSVDPLVRGVPPCVTVTFQSYWQ